MELCVKCFFDNKSDFEKTLNYLKPIIGGDMDYSGQAFDAEPNNWIIETHKPITQAQLDGLTALCPIRPKRVITKQRVYSKIAFGIGLYGSSYHPDDYLDDDTFEDCKILGLDPSAIALELMKEFEILPDYMRY